jgi:maleate cis-trans isomerase
MIYGSKSRIGLIVPSNNTVIEPELYHIAPKGISFHFTKLLMDTPRPSSNIRDVEGESVKILQHSGVNLIVYACMSTSISDSDQWEKEVSRKTGISTTTASSSIKSALKAVNCSKLALVCHYPTAELPPIIDWLESQSLNITKTETANINNQQEVCNISVEEVYKMTERANSDDADAICILGTDLRTFPIIDEIEKSIKKPVISSNLAILWKALKLSGQEEQIAGHGYLLSSLGH